VWDAIAPMGIRGRMGRWIMDRAFDPAADQGALTDKAIATIAADLDRHAGNEACCAHGRCWSGIPPIRPSCGKRRARWRANAGSVLPRI
jgi:hypothetical protein